MSSTNCLNCGSAFTHDAKYCAACGQKAATHRMHFHDIWHDLVHYFTHADKGIFHLLKDLATKPGVVAREFVEGKRQKYFRPLNFFLIVAGIVLFMTGVVSRSGAASAGGPRTAATTDSSITRPSLSEAQRISIERQKNVGIFMSKYANIVNIVAMPLLTIFLWLFYIRGPYNYIEHVVANMYFVGFVMIFYSLLFLPIQRMPGLAGSRYVIGAFFLFEILYRGYAYYQFMPAKGVKAGFKAYGYSVIVSLIWIVLTTTIIGVYIRTGFKF